MAEVIIGKIPENYNDRFGRCVPTEKDLETLDQEIEKRLPDGVTWCGNDLLYELIPGKTIEEMKQFFDIVIEDILYEAYAAVFEKSYE